MGKVHTLEVDVSPAERNHFARFLALLLMAAVLVMVAGFLPTRRLGGEAALTGMVVGCAIGFLASLAGAASVLSARDRRGPDVVPAAMAAMAVRMGVALVLGIAVALSGLVAPKALLLWVVIAHAAFLVPDTHLSIKLLGQRARGEQS